MKPVASPNREKQIFKILILLCFAVFALLLGYAIGWQASPREAGLAMTNGKSTPAAYGQAPDFSLTERSGEAFSKSRLLGKPWIANFIFTSCAGQCPLMSAQMEKLQSQFSPETGMQFVSFTVDPERDTPEVLSEYADRFQAEKGRWFFLTGPRPEINRILREFFLSPVEEPAMHSIRFILVDRDAKIRGYYDSSDAGAMKQLGEDAKAKDL